MGKLNVLIMICVIGLVTVSCIKEKKSEMTNNLQKKVVHTTIARRISNNNIKVSSNSSSAHSTAYEASYSLFSNVGHTAFDCSNGCTTVGGVRCHVNCQGWGNVCSLRATVSVSKSVEKSDSYEAITLENYEPTDETTYNMPARSFFVEDAAFEDGYIWLNIPAQLLVRDSINQPFKYYNISFTKQALFMNL